MALLNASRRSDLQKVLGTVPRPVTLMVFVKSNCDACEETRTLVEELAQKSVSNGTIDATECPELAERYHVHGAPRTIVNDAVHIEEAVPEALLMRS
jgi:hypothetical protein